MSVDKNMAAILSRELELNAIFDKALAVTKMPIAKKAKYIKLVAVADDLNAFLKPNSPCKSGCSHCCHMATAIIDTEAARIAGHINRPYIKQRRSESLEESIEWHNDILEKYTAVPCTFLKDNQCSIYEVRPLACRVHHSVDDTNERCDLYKHPRLTTPSIDCKEIDMAYAVLFHDESWGDIRDYFP